MPMPSASMVLTALKPTLEPTPSEPTAKSCKEATFGNFDIDNKGDAIGVFGILWNKVTHKDGLWHLAKKFNIKNVGAMKKIDVINALSKAHGVWDFCKDNEPTQNVHGKTRHCPFRLLNVIFSDKISDNFGRLGDVSTAGQLAESDTKNEVFWTRVNEAFLDPGNSCGVLHFTNNEVLQGDVDVDPSKIQQHDWEKLSKIHQDV